jgi:transcriptional regulator with XRE-family HTH domain
MDAFDDVLARTPETVKRQVSKNLAIAVRIANVLKEQGKTQRDLARLLGKSESEISRWLTGLHNLELKTIYKIEDVLGIDIVMITQNPSQYNESNNGHKIKEKLANSPVRSSILNVDTGKEFSRTSSKSSKQIG